MPNWEMDKQTDRQATDFIGPSRPSGSTIIKVALSFPKFISTHWKPVYSINFLVRLILVLRPEWAHPFMTMPAPIFFNHFLISMNLYQYAEYQAFSSFCSRDVVDLKFCNLIGQEHFGPYLRNQDFPKREICPSMQKLI